MTIEITSYTKEKIKNLIPDIARLRVEVFREYPFLYIGDFDHEKRYLEKFMKMKDGIVVAAFDNKTLIGIATGYPFIYEANNLKEVLSSSGRNPKDYFCYGESVLRKPSRGRGIGKRFFQEREKHVLSLNHYRAICFYTSNRPVDDPRRPSNYRSLDDFWKSQGFVKHSELIGTISYQEIGEEEETPKEMVFWIKELGARKSMR